MCGCICKVLFGINIVFLLVILDKPANGQLPITVNQNGYEGVTIAISSKIEESALLVQKVKDWMIAASRVLYKATKYQLYFKDVTILLPKTWSAKSDYRKIAGSKFTRAHVRIDEENPVVGKTPYVFGQTGCGIQGQYMHLTTYLMFAGELANFGEIGDVFVHEWGHLRWGLFDEYASIEEASLESPPSFYLDDETWKPVRCTEDVKGSNVNKNTGAPCSLTDGIPEKDCIFLADKDSTATASLMGHQNVLKMEEFCDADDPNTNSKVRHNSEAPNNQNIRCNSKSAWQVMREHFDFKSITPGSPNLDTTPTFTIEIETNQRICLCLDVSGSMNLQSRITKMRAAASNFLLSIVSNGTSVGIVTFNTDGSIDNPMLTIASQSDRDQLVSSLPSSVGGGTSIGAGVETCISVLNSTSESLEGSMIYIVTDGVETNAPYIADVQPTVISEGIIVNTLALGTQSDMQLGSISRASGGKSFFYSENEDSTVLLDAFTSITTNYDDEYIQLYSNSISVSSNQQFVQSITIDETVGRETLFQVTAREDRDIEITVTGPDQTVFQQTSSTLGVTTLKLSGTAKMGTYVISVSSSTGTAVIPAVLSIQSKSRVVGAAAITGTVWLSDDTHVYGSESYTVIYVAVMKGMAPVLKCNVSVVVESYLSSKLQLYDNGVGSDVRENDGIYSAYILSQVFKENGRHTFKVTIQNLDNKAETLTSQQQSDSFPFYLDLSTEPTANFQRVLISNELLVTNYSTDQLLDTLKPSRIVSLRLKSIEVMEGQIKAILTWRAVGDDLDIGTASSYEVRLSDDFSQIQSQPDMASRIDTNVPVPKDSGSNEEMTISTSDTGTKYITLRAVDDAGNKGDYSNIVSIAKLTDTSWIKVSSHSMSLAEPLISGSIALVILSTIIALGICVKRRYSSKKDKEDNIISEKSYHHHRHKRSPYIIYDNPYMYREYYIV